MGLMISVYQLSLSFKIIVSSLTTIKRIYLKDFLRALFPVRKSLNVDYFVHIFCVHVGSHGFRA